jgi:hypothetical protein
MKITKNFGNIREWRRSKDISRYKRDYGPAWATENKNCYAPVKEDGPSVQWDSDAYKDKYSIPIRSVIPIMVARKYYYPALYLILRQRRGQ